MLINEDLDVIEARTKDIAPFFSLHLCASIIRHTFSKLKKLKLLYDRMTCLIWNIFKDQSADTVKYNLFLVIYLFIYLHSLKSINST